MSTTRPSSDPTPVAPVTPADEAPVTTPPGDGASAQQVEREFTIRAMTSRQLVTRRFLRHRGALAGLTVFLFTVILSFSSIGIGPIPGWWGQSFETPNTVLNSGHMTLDLIPFLDGDGLAVGTHPFGQDDVGRDYFALTMRGTQISLMIALLVGLLATAIGVLIGAVAGFYRGATESVLMRITDVIITIPLLVIAAVLGRAVSGAGPMVLAVMIGLLYWTTLARLVRGEFLSLREKEFVEAARAMGASSGRIIFRHILPNALGTIIVSATLTVAAAILLETSLSYLNLGVQPPDTSLGLLINSYQSSFQTRPWLFYCPAIFIVAIALSVNFIGDGLRDAFDPKQTRVRA
jgi:ABC-type dipeptide/oligopeptide/nickel transport system permease subunit